MTSLDCAPATVSKWKLLNNTQFFCASFPKAFDKMRSSFFLYILIVAFVAVSARKWKCESVAAPQCQAHATYNACGPNRFCYTTCGWVFEIFYKWLKFSMISFTVDPEDHHAWWMDAPLVVSVTKDTSWTFLMEFASSLKTVKQDLVTKHKKSTINFVK